MSVADSPIGGRSDASAAAFIEMRGLQKVFAHEGRPFEALHDINITVSRGEFIAIVGPSGCGKSTLLRATAGLEDPTSGWVRIDGEILDGPRQDIGLMLQEATLFPWRTAVDNILLPVDVQRRRGPSDVQRANELLEKVRLSKFARQYPKQLSGGMQQRVALARALMTDPVVLLLDEPFGALDEFTREQLNQELGSIVAAGQETTVLLVTHNVGEAVLLGDRVIAMGTSPGQVVDDIPIPWARPRSPEFQMSDEYRAATARIRRALGLE